MADVIHRTATPVDYRVSVNTPDFPEPTWLANPDLSGVAGVAQKYWNPPGAAGTGPTEMSQSEKDAVDAAETAAATAANRSEASGRIDSAMDPDGWELRANVEVFNKRDNYIINRLVELQEDLQGIKASAGGTANIRAAIRSSYLATDTRTRAQTIQAFKDEISGGGGDR